jgi:hypothetical protein
MVSAGCSQKGFAIHDRFLQTYMHLDVVIESKGCRDDRTGIIGYSPIFSDFPLS